MSVTVLIPTALRPGAGNQSSLRLEGASVQEVLGELARCHPALGRRLYERERELNRYINVYLNDEDIRFLQALDTPVADGDEISLVPAVAGG